VTVVTVGLSAPLVTLAHDWTSDVVREATYPTTVLERRDRTEQRQALSTVRSERLTYRLLAPSAEHAAILHTLPTLATDRLIRMPRWEDQVRLTAAASSGGSSLTVNDTTYLPTFEVGAAIILWRDPFTYELAEIDTVSGTSIATVDPLAATWAAGTIVCVVEPVRLAFPLDVTHWRATSGALEFVVDRLVNDVAGLGTGGSATTGTTAAITLNSRRLSSLGLLRFARGALVARCTTAAGDDLTGVPVVWSSSDPTNLGVWATADAQVAVIENLRPDASLGSSVNRVITATVGAVTEDFTVGLRW
jgi:hypothetical protein